jgi:protein-disulfide isomerase
MRGSANAPLTLIEYSDFTCGYCLKFFQETWPRLRAKYVETGKVRFLYRDYPRADHGPGVDAAIAARCAGEQGQYWAMHDRLFSAGGKLTTALFLDQARTIGLNQPRFAQCLKDDRHAKAAFQDREQGMSFGFRGTPGFVLLRTEASPSEEVLTIPGAFPYQVFEEQIDRLLATAEKKERLNSRDRGAILHSQTGTLTRGSALTKD